MYIIWWILVQNSGVRSNTDSQVALRSPTKPFRKRTNLRSVDRDASADTFRPRSTMTRNVHGALCESVRCSIRWRTTINSRAHERVAVQLTLARTHTCATRSSLPRPTFWSRDAKIWGRLSPRRPLAAAESVFTGSAPVQTPVALSWQRSTSVFLRICRVMNVMAQCAAMCVRLRSLRKYRY